MGLSSNTLRLRSTTAGSDNSRKAEYRIGEWKTKEKELDFSLNRYSMPNPYISLPEAVLFMHIPTPTRPLDKTRN